MQQYSFKPIGIIQSCFKEKFAIPRQPGLVKEATATLKLVPPYNRVEALDGIDGFSHLWISFVFHAALDKNAETDWKPKVRPPRLGGNKSVGVFASRSMFRPNPIGLSVVELNGVDRSSDTPTLHLRGVDLLDGTPVLDIKPYLGYVDAIADARGGFAQDAPLKKLTVSWSAEAMETCNHLKCSYPELDLLITHLIELDPRPAYQGKNTSKAEYGMTLYELNIRWLVSGKEAQVLSILPE
jgi:tRNA-Thr(GGU) m(6)t(6)A37 methyltransferase TsaA